MVDWILLSDCKSDALGLSQFDSDLRNFNKISYLCHMATQLTPAILVEKGFKYTAPGISGADMWQGRGFWDNKSKQVLLRGNVSTAKGGRLCPMEIPNLIIESVEELEIFLSLLK